MGYTSQPNASAYHGIGALLA